MNATSPVRRVARLAPDRPALVGPDRSLTYGQLDDLTDRLAGFLRASGAREGDRIALFFPNSTAFAVAYLAALKAGCAAVSINPQSRAAELRHILGDSGARTLFVAPELLGELDPIRSELPDLQQVITGWEQIDACAAQAEPIGSIDVPSEAPAALLYTSGTTGLPKGAVLSHHAVITNVMAAQFCSRTTGQDRLLCYVPLSHCFGQNFILNNALLAGATLFIHERFDQQAVWDTIRDQQITMLFGVPASYRTLIASLPGNYRPGGSLRFAFSGADTSPPDLTRAWEEAAGLPLSQGYGLTEAGPFVSFNHFFRYKPGSLGMPVPGFEMEIVDPEGRALPPGEPGEIRLRGPSLMSGYWRNPAATAAAIRDGWLYTGDVGVQDEDGDFFLVDRVKDVINTSGFKVYPREVEAALITHPDVSDCAVVGLADPQKGEITQALIVWRQGAKADPEGLRSWLKERIAAYKVPHRFEQVDSLPRGATGKLLRSLLRRQPPAAD